MSNNTTVDLDDMSSLTSSSAIDSKKKKEFDKKRDTILSSIPRDVYKRFGTICFASYSKFLGPVLILSPYSVAPGVLRDNWFTMFRNCLDSGRKMTYLVYWYGCSNDLQNAYSFQKTSSLTSYEDGMKKLRKKMLLTLQQKLSRGKKLSGKETMLLNAMEEMKMDQTKNPEDRSGYLPLPQDGTRNNTVVSTVTATANVTAPREQRNNPKKAAAATNNNNNRTKDVDVDADSDPTDRIKVNNSNKRRHHQQRTIDSDSGNDRTDDAVPKHSVKKAKMDDCNPRPSTRIRMASSYNNVSAIKKEEDDDSNAGSGIHSGGNDNNANTLPNKSTKQENTNNVSARKQEEDDSSNAGSGIHSGGNNNNNADTLPNKSTKQENTNNVSAIKKEEDDNSNAGIGIHSGGNNNNNADTLPNKSIKKENMNNKCDDDSTNDGIPTPVQLSQELSRLTSERYSRNEALGALKKIDQWAAMNDANFLKSFHAYGGILRILDFLKVVITDTSIVDGVQSKIRADCIEEITDIIVEISYTDTGNDGGRNNIEIVKKILLTVIDHEYDGIATLIRVSERCTDRYCNLNMSTALELVWRAITNISSTVYNEMTEEQITALFMEGITVISKHEKIDYDDDASGTIESVFMSFSAIINNQYMNKAQFQEKKLLSKCIGVLKTKKDGWNCKCEETTVAAIRFFDRCRCNKLFDEDSDYVSVLPFLIFGMTTYPRSKHIRSTVLDFIQGACDNMKDKKRIENPAMEGLCAIFTRDDIDEEEKNRIRTLIVNTVADMKKWSKVDDADDESEYTTSDDPDDDRSDFKKLWCRLRKKGWYWKGANNQVDDYWYIRPASIRPESEWIHGTDYFCTQDEVVTFVKESDNALSSDEIARSDDEIEH